MSHIISGPVPVFPRKRTPIHPVFLPGMGCPRTCIYCDQALQTGVSSRPLPDIYHHLSVFLQRARAENRPPFELAFFGGTFTALPRKWQIQFVDLVQGYKASGMITALRCSTRPDACDPQHLLHLQNRGLDLIELGAQSFDPWVLRASGRGYTPECIHRACRDIRESGLSLGIQLLPGLPRHTIPLWLKDIRHTCALKPAFVRIYPCLVLAGTPLHNLWTQGRFQPWSLDMTVTALARALLRLWRADIPIIRMGLHPEPGLVRSIQAGPWHPALGTLVRSRVLMALISAMSRHLPPGPKVLTCPGSVQGELWGYKGSYRLRLHSLGISSKRIVYHQHPRIDLCLATSDCPLC